MVGISERVSVWIYRSQHAKPLHLVKQHAELRILHIEAFGPERPGQLQQSAEIESSAEILSHGARTPMRTRSLRSDYRAAE